MRPKRGTRCVVWHPPGPGGTPGVLLRSLARAGAAVEPVRDRFAALAVLARDAGPRRESAGTRAGSPHVVIPVLVLAEPQRLRGVDEVLHAARKYAPRAVIWTYRHDGTPRLSDAAPALRPRRAPGDADPAVDAWQAPGPWAPGPRARAEPVADLSDAEWLALWAAEPKAGAAEADDALALGDATRPFGM